MAVQLGDKGPQVSEIQKLLSLLGYDLIVDGDFGARTQRSITAFQKKSGLDADGVVGEKTLAALKAAQKRTAKEDKSPIIPKEYGDAVTVNTSHPLPIEQYMRQVTEKKQIYIHFTAGGPSAANVISGWNADEPKISTSYVIDGDTGEIFQCFHPNYWSFHLGIKGTNGKVDKASIGIEICAWGPITEKAGKFYTYTNKEISSDKVYKLDTPFRGYKYFHKYTDAQLESLEKLLMFLVKEYKIPVQSSFDKSWFEFNQQVIDKVLPGIWTHTTVRKDKTDSYPDERLIALLNRVAQNS